ncbi:hypothetical protein SNE40_002703 [Patella caerulea]|uniref:Uncharacterized protein n=1 Tax=Patella caerulea TaxID=87958 RepID=A0AAN8KEE5_PATCE
MLFNQESSDEVVTDRNHNKKKISGCPGCCVPDLATLINSRTYNIVLESSTQTCSFHRHIRILEREFIKNTKSHTAGSIRVLRKSKRQSKNEKNSSNIYDFQSPCDRKVSPPEVGESSSDEILAWRLRMRRNQERRNRVEYTEQEVDNLIEGIETFGSKWNQILLTYKFHPSRTSVDLRDKYKSLVKTGKNDRAGMKRRHKIPFSMCEERRLKRGIKVLGYNWKGILKNYKFSNRRTAEDLRNKWRNMNKKQTNNN